MEREAERGDPFFHLSWQDQPFFSENLCRCPLFFLSMLLPVEILKKPAYSVDPPAGPGGSRKHVSTFPAMNASPGPDAVRGSRKNQYGRKRERNLKGFPLTGP